MTRASDDTPRDDLPRNAIVVLLDSLNRHLLGAYGGTEFDTPNLDRIARRSVRFERHYAGSLPCMPARHDLFCGSWDFLWRPWGSIEIWESPITEALRSAGVVTKLVSDHPHLFETGGENYHTDFTAWDYQRGHESDPWQTRPDPSAIGAPSFGKGVAEIYERSRARFHDEAAYPGPRTMRAAADWLDENADAHDRFFLFVDEFDPHEPFDTPEPYASMYDDTWEGPHLIWPPYAKAARAEGVLTDREAHQIRACYGAKLTMIDHWLGRLLDTIDRHELWADTAVVVCTDHGHYLGERDIWGKPPVPLFEPLSHLPLLVSWPGLGPGTVDALTTTVDLHATLLDVFGATARHRTHGRSLVPLLEGGRGQVRDYVLAGVWGREVHVIDGDRKYARAPVAANEPLGMWSNRWSTMPVPGAPDEYRLPLPDDRAFLDRMPGSTVPVIHQTWGVDDSLPYWAWGGFSGNHLYALTEDPHEERNLAGGRPERDAEDLLRAALEEVEAPYEQQVRLGLA